MKISIFAFAVNDKFPIDILYRQYTKFIKNNFEFILMNDAIDSYMEEKINDIASINQIKCVRVPQEIHIIQNPSESYATSLNWAVQKYAIENDSDIIVLVHTDIFPLQEININNIIEQYAVASTMEFRNINGEEFYYFYPAFTIINMKLIKNVNELDFNIEPGKFDTGGKTYLFVKNNMDQIKFLYNHPICNRLSGIKENILSEYFEKDLLVCTEYGLNAGWVSEGFYHYMAGSQWNASNPIIVEGHKARMNLFMQYFD